MEAHSFDEAFEETLAEWRSRYRLAFLLAVACHLSQPGQAHLVKTKKFVSRCDVVSAPRRFQLGRLYTAPAAAAALPHGEGPDL